MPQIYTASLDATAATAQISLCEITPADDKVCCIHSIVIGQTTELGDAAEEQLELEIHRGGTAMSTGSGGTAAANGQSTDRLGPTSGFTFEAGNTTLATFTGGTVIYRDTFNVRAGWQYTPPPEDRIYVSQANGGLCIRLGAAPADSVTFTCTVVVEEL